MQFINPYLLKYVLLEMLDSISRWPVGCIGSMMESGHQRFTELKSTIPHSIM